MDIKKRIAAFKYAFQGVRYLFANEAHAKFHLFVAICVIVAGVYFDISATEWCLVLLSIGGVLMAEAVNTAIEQLADKISPEYDPKIKVAKDVAAGAVLLFVLSVIFVGLIIFLPKFWIFFE